MTRNQRKIKEISRYLWEHYRWPLLDLYIEYAPHGEAILCLTDNNGGMYPVDIFENRDAAKDEKAALEGWLRELWSQITAKE